MSIDYPTVFREIRGELGYRQTAKRAELARLRRLGPRADAPDRIDISPLAESFFARLLLRRLGLAKDGVVDVDRRIDRIERAAAALGALAAISDEVSAPHPARALHAVMSEDRFVRLLRMETPAEILANGRRLVRMLGGRTDPGALGADLYWWSPKTRTRWAFLYYGDPDNQPDALISSHSGDAA